MSERGGILLTGATGLLGRYLLSDLLLLGRRLTVLVRDGSAPAAERIADWVASRSEVLQTRLPSPTVVVGDLRSKGLGLGAADRAWLARSCTIVVHAAASVSFRSTPDGEPRKTNLDGTLRLLELCAELGLAELHHVSTAFVCGQRTGTIREDELHCGQAFHNDYEKSKCAAERLVRQAGKRVTVYRPSVIVGDSRDGYTSGYHGFYRFLELADRLAESTPGGRRLPLRWPGTGDEPRNLVPVDWVARAIACIVAHPRLQGQTYHLTASQTVPARLIKEVAEEVLGIAGVGFAGAGGNVVLSSLERSFLEHLKEYGPYLRGDPAFACDNTLAALPDLPAPKVDRALLARVISFAKNDNWGRGRRPRNWRGPEMDCAHYVEDFFPTAVERSALAGLGLRATVGLDVRGAGGGRWSCRWDGDERVAVRRGQDGPTDVVYKLDAETFAAIVGGRLKPEEAFFARRIEIEGNIEKGLKLAVLFGQFVRECPFSAPQQQQQEVDDAQPLSL